MVEFLAVRDFQTGASTDWDVLPEMQVTVSRRQHFASTSGCGSPSPTPRPPPQVQFYVLWDWADGKFWEGWR